MIYLEVCNPAAVLFTALFFYFAHQDVLLKCHKHRRLAYHITSLSQKLKAMV